MIYAIGSFDGFHTGHRTLLDKAHAAAPSENGWGVITFDINPQYFFEGGSFKQLFTDEERNFCARLLGIPKLVRISFTKQFSRLSPKAFLDLLKNKYNATGIVVGENFRFGADRAGDIYFIQNYCAENNLFFAVVKMVRLDDKNVSSTEIRALLGESRVKAAARALGFPFFVSGIVEKGEQRGRKLGFPTVNLSPASCKLYPKNGSYVTMTLTEGRIYPSVTNIGFNPTFNGRKLVCETHILGYSGNLYGKKTAVFFIDSLRQEKKFENVAELTAQLDLDVKIAAERASDYIAENEKLIALIKAAGFDRE